MGVDFAGNDTDEKVPISLFLKDIDGFLEGMAAQTDGSSVVLTGIATLNNARVDMKIDSSVNWYIDYNYEHFDSATGRMVGTLRIPCFLVHNNVRVDSRSILHDTLDYVEKELLELFKKHPQIAGLEHISGEDIEKIIFTCATELEFWVKSPREDAPIEALSSSQMMQEEFGVHIFRCKQVNNFAAATCALHWNKPWKCWKPTALGLKWDIRNAAAYADRLTTTAI